MNYATEYLKKRRESLVTQNVSYIAAALAEAQVYHDKLGLSHSYAMVH